MIFLGSVLPGMARVVAILGQIVDNFHQSFEREENEGVRAIAEKLRLENSKPLLYYFRLILKRQIIRRRAPSKYLCSLPVLYAMSCFLHE